MHWPPRRVVHVAIGQPKDLGHRNMPQWKRISSMSTLIKHMLHFSGATESSRGRPLYADMARDMAPGSADRPLEGDPAWGGRHPLGPSVALNFKRFAHPNAVHPGHPGVNACIAGAVDAAGNPLKILSVQTNLRKKTGHRAEHPSRRLSMTATLRSSPVACQFGPWATTERATSRSAG